jgi:hypothetical protein
MSVQCCQGCGRDSEKGQWWRLNNYFGFTGRFCPCCYDRISHDSYGRPNRPADYLLMVIKLGVDRPKN